jgi:hypothetical protein
MSSERLIREWTAEADQDTAFLVHRFRGSNHIDMINQPRPERALARVSKEVRGVKFHPVRSDPFHGIDPLDDRFHESCHKRGIPFGFRTPINRSINIPTFFS